MTNQRRTGPLSATVAVLGCSLLYIPCAMGDQIAQELALSAVRYTVYSNTLGLTDIAFHQPGGPWVTVPVLFSMGSPFAGTWVPKNNLADFANQPGVIAIPGDFNGDGRSDIAFYKPGSTWNSVPVLFSGNGDGTWRAANFAADFANQPDVIALPGDYNGDGKTDIAFYRPDGVWNSVPVLLSNGDGSWTAKNFIAPNWANQAGVIAVPGDYNGDGRTDIAFYKPGGGWTTVPVLFSDGDGSWSATNMPAPSWANQLGVIAVPGDFNHDGRADLAFYWPGGSWNTLPVLFGKGFSGWTSSNFVVPSWANAAGVVAVPGDFNGDGFSDIAFYNPGSAWTTMPVLFSHGENVPWTSSNFAVPNWVNQTWVKAIPGYYTAGCNTGLAFYRPGGGWSSVPVLFSNGESAPWSYSNGSAPDWANQSWVIGIHGNAKGSINCVP